MSAFDAVLWDYGGIFTASPFGAAHAYARSQDVDPARMVEIVFGAYDSDTDHAWHQLERGEISFVDALTQIKAAAEAHGFRFDTGEMFSMMVTDEIDRGLVVEAVRMVRAKGLKTAIVTNNIREYGDAWRGPVPARRAVRRHHRLVRGGRAQARPHDLPHRARARRRRPTRRARSSSTTSPATSTPPAPSACTASSWATTPPPPSTSCSSLVP